MQVDNRHQKEPVITSEQAKQMCNRNFGIGGDGVSILSILQILSDSWAFLGHTHMPPGAPMHAEENGYAASPCAGGPMKRASGPSP